MSFNIETTPNFERELKDLAKRYKSMKQDFWNFKESLKKIPVLCKVTHFPHMEQDFMLLSQGFKFY